MTHDYVVLALLGPPVIPLNQYSFMSTLLLRVRESIRLETPTSSIRKKAHLWSNLPCSAYVCIFFKESEAFVL